MAYVFCPESSEPVVCETVRIGNVELVLAGTRLRGVLVNGEPVAAQSLRIEWDGPNVEARAEIGFFVRAA